MTPSRQQRTNGLRAQLYLFPDTRRTLFCFDRNKHKVYGHADYDKHYKGFTKALRFKIFKRDGFTCQVCDEKATDETNKGQRGSIQLDAHHINYDKYDCRAENLVTCCHSCHSKTNSNRTSWRMYFEEKLK